MKTDDGWETIGRVTDDGWETVEQPKHNALVRGASQAASGVFEGGAGLATLPLDLARWGMRKAGVPEEYLPYGSEAAKAGMQRIGLTQPAPTTGTERTLRTVGEHVGASAVPAGLALKAARTAAPLIPAIGRGAAPAGIIRGNMWPMPRPRFRWRHGRPGRTSGAARHYLGTDSWCASRCPTTYGARACSSRARGR